MLAMPPLWLAPQRREYRITNDKAVMLIISHVIFGLEIGQIYSFHPQATSRPSREGGRAKKCRKDRVWHRRTRILLSSILLHWSSSEPPVGHLAHHDRITSHEEHWRTGKISCLYGDVKRRCHETLPASPIIRSIMFIMINLSRPP